MQQETQEYMPQGVHTRTFISGLSETHGTKTTQVPICKEMDEPQHIRTTGRWTAVEEQ